MEDQPFSVFLSVGTADTAGQEAFVEAIEAHLKSHGCEPITVGRSKYSARQPVQAARDLIGECEGAIVVAFERTRIIQGLEKPAGAHPLKVRNESHPTIWNQMEAAMAYGQHVPILTIVQQGLKRQGMLSKRLEWVALEGELTLGLLASDEFRQMFGEWLKHVYQRRASKKAVEIDPGELKIGYLFSQLRPRQLAVLITSVLAVLSVIATTAYKMGQWSHSG